jgi:RNase P subunit RPR2
MSLAARLRKLEVRYRPILLCRICQYLAATGKRELRAIPPATLTIRTCRFCGARHGFDLKNRDEPTREVLSLILEADPIKRYFDERVYSAARWYKTRKSEVKTYQQAIKSEDQLRFFLPYPRPAIHNVETTTILSSRERKHKQEIDDLRQLADSYVRKETEKIKRSINAPETFPVVSTIEQISTEVRSLKSRRMAEILNSVDEQSDSRQQLEFELNACFVHLENLKTRQAHEVVIWDHSLSITLDEIRFFESEIEKRAAEAMPSIVQLALEKLGAADQVLEPPDKETPGERAVVGLEQDSPTSDKCPSPQIHEQPDWGSTGKQIVDFFCQSRHISTAPDDR